MSFSLNTRSFTDISLMIMISIIFLVKFCAPVALKYSNPFYNEDCPVPDLASECVSICSEIYAKCVSSCTDEVCNSSCRREGLICVDFCPCYDECFNGNYYYVKL